MVIIDIYLSTVDRKQVIQLPALPEELPLFDMNLENEEFETLEGTVINLKTYKKNLNITTIESFFPYTPKRYAWLRSDIDWKRGLSFINSRTFFKEPIRYIVTDKNETLRDGLVTVESFNTTMLSNKDIAYSLTLKEYMEEK